MSTENLSVELDNGTANPNSDNPGADPSDDLESLLPLQEGGDDELGDDEVTAGPDEDNQETATEAAPIKDDVIVEVKGEKVPLSDLKASYERQQAFTAKEMAFADERRDFVARAQAAVVQERQVTTNFIPGIVEKVLEAFAPRRSPNEVYQMTAGDQAAYAAYQTQQEVANNIRVWAQNVSQEALQTAFAQQQEYAKQLAGSEHEKVRSKDFMNDQWLQNARSYGLKNGIPEARLSEYVYAGEMDIINKAMKWDEAQAKLKAGKVAPKAAPQAPQKGRANNTAQADPRKFAELEKRAKAGDVRARASVLGALMPLQE